MTGAQQPGVDPAAERDWALEELAATVARLKLRLDDLERFLPAPDDPLAQVTELTSGAPRPPGDAFDVYLDLDGWVTHYFAVVYPRPVGGHWRWCPRWHEHPEAVERLDALWRTWEAWRLAEQSGMADWLRLHLDHQLPILLGASGPFSACAAGRHEPTTPLPLAHRTASPSPELLT